MKNKYISSFIIGCLILYSCNDSGANRRFSDVELAGFKGPVKSITETIDDDYVIYDSFNLEGIRVLQKMGTKRSLLTGGGITLIFKKNEDNLGYNETLKNQEGSSLIIEREFDKFGNLTMRKTIDSTSGDVLGTVRFEYSDFGLSKSELTDDFISSSYSIKRDKLGRMKSKHYKSDSINNSTTKDGYDQFYIYGSNNNIKSTYRVSFNGDTTHIKLTVDKYGNMTKIIEILNDEIIKDRSFITKYYEK